MTITYQITRIDLVHAYFYNLRHSSRSRITILVMSAILIGYSLFLAYNFRHQLTPFDFIVAIFAALLMVFFLLPLFNFIFAKTQKRSLTLTPQGIRTQIGSQEGTIPWKSVAEIVSNQDNVIMLGKNANAFIIPLSAFSNREQKQAFVDLARQYHSHFKG